MFTSSSVRKGQTPHKFVAGQSSKGQPSITKNSMGGPSSVDTTCVEGRMRKHCHRSCTAAAISTPTPSGASQRKAAKNLHSGPHQPPLQYATHRLQPTNSKTQPSITNNLMGGPSSVDTTCVEGRMRKHCHRSCTAAAISTPTPSGASLRKAAQPPPQHNFPSSHHSFSAKTPSSVRTQVESSTYLRHPKSKLSKALITKALCPFLH